MPRSAAVSVENQFNKGLVTEASGLNFPENSCTDTYDCVFTVKGTVRRRLGFEYESGYSLGVDVSTDVTNSFITEYVWENVGSLGALTFTVQQVGNKLFYFETSSTTGLSNNKKSFTTTLSTFSTSGSPSPISTACQFASGNGDLFVFHPYLEPFYVTYNSDTDTITASAISIRIRDFAGVSDGFEVEVRPNTIPATHKYNLYNQGWYGTVVVDGGSSSNPLTYWDTNRSDYPSNADVWWLFKDSDDELKMGQIGKISRGNSPAPKGHYTINPFYQDRSGVSSIPGLTVVSSSFYRPTAGAFFSSRVFYGGTNFSDFGGKIYFSQIIEDKTYYGLCHQINDPTSEDLSDLYPTDGGVIVIPDMGTVIKMFPYSNSLLVFASNGIWAISGSQGTGFAANDYSIKKISSVPSISHLSFVLAEGSIFWWNSDGIYVVQTNPASGDISVNSLTDQTIKSYLNDIPSGNIYYVKGSYNSLDKVIQWIFRSSSFSTLAEAFQYDRVLNYRLTTQAFYPWTITQPNTGPYICGILSIKGFGVSRENGIVINNAGDKVVDGSSNQVIVETVIEDQQTASFRYPTIVHNSHYFLTFAQERDAGYRDWSIFDGVGVDYDSYFITGYKVHGQGQRVFQGNYLIVFSEIESSSSCYAQYLWDYATSGSSGRYSNPEQIYLARANTALTTRRVILRGQGLALQIKFYSEDNKPFNIVGYSMFETGNSTP